MDLAISSYFNSKQNHEIVIFTVKDTGLSIEEKYLDKKYKPFFQKNLSTTKAYKKAHLRRAIAKKFIKYRDDEITLKTKVGIGSTFIVKLSLKQSSEKDLKADKYFNNTNLDDKNALIITENEST